MLLSICNILLYYIPLGFGILPLVPTLHETISLCTSPPFCQHCDEKGIHGELYGHVFPPDMAKSRTLCQKYT